MWFRNLRLYRLGHPEAIDLDGLDAALAAHATRPCGALEPFTVGWAPPLGRRSQGLSHVAGGRAMLCCRREDKLLPASLVRERSEDRAAEIEQAEGRPLGRKARAELREQVLTSLLPQALARASHTYAYLEPKAGWLVIDAASDKRAEELVSLLRDSLDGLPAVPPASNESPATVMTRWLAGGPLPAGFVLGDECELREPVDGGAVARFRHQELGGREIVQHLEAGMQVTRLALEWEERIGLVLDEQLAARRLRFLEGVEEEAQQVEADDHASRFDADFAIMGGELARFLPALLEACGGLAEE